MNPVLASLLVGLGGAAGAIARYWIGVVGMHLSPAFPAGTLVVNAAGGLAIGLAAGFEPAAWVRLALMSGFLGGFTTFSTFSLEVVAMLEGGRIAKAVVYVGASVALAVVGAAVGLLAARSGP